MCVSHLPFQPAKQHEADLRPFRITAPLFASEQGDEIDLRGPLLYEQHLTVTFQRTRDELMLHQCLSVLTSALLSVLA